MTATSTTETEWKYEAPSGGTVPDLTGLPRVAEQSDSGAQTLSAVYYDTDDLVLIRAGITLRRRSGGHDAGWHLKLPDRPGTRTEIQMPLREELPDELAALLTARLRGRRVHAVAQITTRRRRHVLLDGSGTSLAEVVADDVVAEALGDSRPAERWSEVEVELTGGGMDLLEAADARLRERGMARSEWSSKLKRALAGRLAAVGGEPEDEDGESDPTAADVVCAYVRIQRDELLAQDPRVRMDEPEAVHDMRVAARRLRSALQAFPRVLRHEETSAVIEELRWLGRRLGRSRDHEVVAERLEAALDRLPGELVIGPVERRIEAYATPGPDADQAASTRILDSHRYLALLDALDRLIAFPPLADHADRRAAKALPKAARRAFKRVGRRADAAFAAEPGQEQDVALHATRKAAKRARYAAETAQLGEDEKAVRKTISDLKELQTALGDHQDTVLTRPAALRLGIAAHSAGENAFTYGLLHAHESASSAASLDEAKKVWSKATRAKRTRWMR
jgi:CHAD domain-containing protein